MKKNIKIKINIKDLIKVTTAAAIGYAAGKIVEAGVDSFCEVKRLADKYLAENGIGETECDNPADANPSVATATAECDNRDEIDNLPCKAE